MDDEILAECRKRYAMFAAMNMPWPYGTDSGDEQVEEVYPPQKLDPKDMSVKADTEEDRERLWQSVLDYAKG